MNILKFIISKFNNSGKKGLIQHHSSKAGFTLVELIIYMGILAILIYMLTDILSAILNVQLSTQSNSQVVQDGRYIYSRLTYDINRAQSVSTPAVLGDTSNHIEMVIDASNYSYNLTSGSLAITDAGGTHILNSPDTTITNLQFKRIGNTSGKHTFQIDFTIQSKTKVNSRYDTEIFQTVAGLR